MGTSYTVKIGGAALGAAGQSLARQAVQRALDDVVRAMSFFDPASELSRFNRHGAGAPLALSRDTFQVLELARRVSLSTAGAFDVTVGPLVDAWGFGPRAIQRIPHEEERRALAPRVGFERLGFDERNRTVTKARPDVHADLGGIAKGFGVDQAARALDALGIGHYLVEAGGEVRARGLNAEAVPWRIGIEQPDAGPRSARLVVPLRDLSMATSGDYRIYFERDGRRYCHEIDPDTGLAIQNGLASVTVVARECAFADAMATALMVMGPRAGYAHCVEHGIAAHFILRRADGALLDRATPAFAALGAAPA